MGGRREVSILPHRPVTSCNLKQERLSLFSRGSHTLACLPGGFREPGLHIGRARTHDEPLKTFAGRLLSLGLRGVFPITRNLEACAASGRLCNVWGRGVCRQWSSLKRFGSGLLLHSVVASL